MNHDTSRHRFLIPLLLLAPLTAQNKEPDPGLVERTIARLAAADPKVADAAMIALIRGDRASTPLLRAVLVKKPPAEVAERAERALRICEIDAPIENGVKVGLRVDQKRVLPGDPIRFTSTLCNLTDAPVAVFLGMSYSGNVLENGSALAQQVAADTEGAIEGLIQARLGAVGFCGTGARPLVVLVKPWATHEFVMSLEYRTEAKANDACQCDGTHLAGDWFFLPLATEDRRLRLQLRHEVVAKQAVGMAEPEHKANWDGVLRSNVVEVELGSRPAR